MSLVYGMTTSGLGHPVELVGYPAGGMAAGRVMAERAVAGGRFPLGYSKNGSIVTMAAPLVLEGPEGKYAYTGMGSSAHSGNSCGSCSQQPQTRAGETTNFTGLSPSGGCSKTVKRHVRYCDTPPSPGVTSSMVDHPDGSFTVTYYPGSRSYKPAGTTSTTTTTTSSKTTSSGSCSSGACARPTPTPTPPRAPAPAPAPAPALPPPSKKSPGQKDVAILIFGPNVTATAIYQALTVGAYNNFSGVDRPLVEDLTLAIQYTGNVTELRDFIRSPQKCDVIITYGKDANKVLPVCRETGYDGSLLLIGGATSGVIDVDKSVCDTVSSVITTHGFGDGKAIVSKDDHAAMVGVDTWVYVNDHDSFGNPASLIGNANRRYRYPYLLELVRALKLGHNGNDWKRILESKLYRDNRNVVHDYWP